MESFHSIADPQRVVVIPLTRDWCSWSTWPGSYQLCAGSPGIFDCQVLLTEEVRRLVSLFGHELTWSGLEHYREIVKAFFQYVSLLRDQPPQE
jgi:hypothetical protein